MKIAFAIKGLGVPGGGAERVLVDVANGLAERGHDVTVISSDAPDKASFYPLNGNVTWIRLGIGAIDRPATIVETGRRIRALRRTVPRLEPDVAVGFMHSTFIPLGLALMGTNIPMIASEHIIPAHYVGRPLERALLRLTPRLARRITVVSEQVMAEYPPFLRNKMIVVPNPVQFQRGARADAVSAGRARKILLSVGRLTEQKDYATLIAAFARIAGFLPDWDLRIVGEGPLRETLEAQVAAAAMGGRIFLPGSTGRIDEEYRSAHLFVIPSLYESFGMALIEALSYGLPAVGFADCPGVNRLIRTGWNGALAEGEDRVRALAAVLASLMSDDEARAQLVRPETTSFREYDPEAVLDKWEDLLGSAILCGSPLKASRRDGRVMSGK